MKPLTGLSDSYGHSLRRKNYVIATFSQVAESFGYEPLSVSLIERAEAYSPEVVGLSPWPEWNRNGCFFFDVHDYDESYSAEPFTRQAVLVPEGTLSVTRWLGDRFDVDTAGANVLPAKIYYEQRCFRNELLSTLGAVKGREFQQFGVEILGAAGIVADMEPMVMAHQCLAGLGVSREKIVFRASSNELFLDMARRSGIGDHDRVALKEQLDTIAECKAGKKPRRRDAALVEARGIIARCTTDGLLRAGWDWIIDRPLGPIRAVDHERLPEQSERLTALSTMVDALGGFGVTVEVDFCVVRSHEYYTGITFEVDLIGAQRHVEVGGGGRYDRLMGNFVPEGAPKIIPSTGFAFGVERLLAALTAESSEILKGQQRLVRTYHLDEESASIGQVSIEETNPEVDAKSYLDLTASLAPQRRTGRVSVVPASWTTAARSR